MQPEYTPEVRFFDSNYRRPCDVAWSDPWGQEHWQEYILCVIWKDQTIEVRSTDKNIYSVSVGKIRLLRSGVLTGIHTLCHLERSDAWSQEYWQEYVLCVIWKDQTLEVRSTLSSDNLCSVARSISEVGLQLPIWQGTQHVSVFMYVQESTCTCKLSPGSGWTPVPKEPTTVPETISNPCQHREETARGCRQIT